MKKSVLYSIVIPVYGTAQSLFELAKNIKSVFKAEKGKEYELIFVNDCSPNLETAPTLEQIFKNDDNVTIISLTKNFGQQAATLCGINHINGDYVITMDDDLQHQPKYIPLFFEKESHDVVIAAFPEKKHSLFKRMMSHFKGWFDHLILKKPKHIQLTAFRMINRHIAQGLRECNTPFPFIPAMLFGLTVDIVNVKIPHHDRMDGTSQYSLLKMILLFSNLLINNSYLLLRLLGIIGMSGFLLSIMVSSYLVIRKLFWGFSIVGWASQMLAITFFGGLILFGLGVIGEYLLRILANLENKHMFFIKNIQKH
jgi:glycosyltransferase involved in cell wall biosynthesis